MSARVIVRCPYCVVGNQFRPMVTRSEEGWFECLSCGHVVMHLDPDFRSMCFEVPGAESGRLTQYSFLSRLCSACLARVSPFHVCDLDLARLRPRAFGYEHQLQGSDARLQLIALDVHGD